VPSFVRTRDNCLVISTEGNLAAQEAKKRNLLGDTYCQKFSLCLIFQYSTKKSDKTDSQFIHDKKHCCFSFYLANILLPECIMRLCPDSIVKFGPDRIACFNVQNPNWKVVHFLISRSGLFNYRIRWRLASLIRAIFFL